MPPVGFEPTISGGERQQTYALDRAVTGTLYSINGCNYLFTFQVISSQLHLSCKKWQDASAILAFNTLPRLVPRKPSLYANDAATTLRVGPLAPNFYPRGNNGRNSKSLRLLQLLQSSQ